MVNIRHFPNYCFNYQIIDICRFLKYSNTKSKRFDVLLTKLFLLYVDLIQIKKSNGTYEPTKHHSNLNLWHTLFEETQKLNDCQAFKQLECKDKKWKNFRLYTIQ